VNFIDAILNLATVLLWLQWRSLRTAHPPLPTKSLLSLLQPTDKPLAATRILVFLTALLLVRALFYWQIGSPLHWVPNLPFGPVPVPFRSDFLGLMLLYSMSAGAHAIVVMYFWLLLLSVVNQRVPDSEAFQRWVRLHLGRAERLPWWARLALPALIVALAWLALHPFFVWLQLLPAAKSSAHLVEEACVVGAGAFLAWKLLLVVVLVLHVLNTYIYFGAHPFWSFIDATGRNLVRPLNAVPMRLGRFDAAPLLVIALAWALGWWLANPRFGLPKLVQKLPL
jgi:hypothetical protein